MKHLTQLLALIPLTFISCNKEKDSWNFSTDIISIDNITEEDVSIGIRFNLGGYENALDGGLYWADHEGLNSSDPKKEIINVKEGDKTISLDNLFGNTTYYVQSYLWVPEDGNMKQVKSPEYSFTTDQVEEADCPTTLNKVNMDNGSTDFDVTCSTLSGQQFENYYQLETSFSVGTNDFQFRFKEFPKSGIYHTNDSFTDLDDHEVSVLAHIQETWTCVYQCSGNFTVHVINDGQDNVEISFCDVIVTSNGGCTQYWKITGKLTN